MNIVTHKEIPEDERLRQQWNLLAEKMVPAEVFYTYEWALAVARSYKDFRSPLLVLGYENDILVGIAALALCENRRVEFLNANTADYCDFISSPEYRDDFVEAVLSEVRGMGIRSAALANLPAESRTAGVVAERGSCRGFHKFSRKAYECGQIEFTSPEQREAVRELLASKKGVRRDIAALARLGRLQVTHPRSREELANALPDFFGAHVARFLDKDCISNIARPERRAFLCELAELLTEAGWMRLSILTAGERKIAWNYGFEFAGSWFWYQPTFDTELRKYFPGFCLLAMLAEEGVRREAVHRIDLGLGEESYKKRLATAQREIVHVTLSRSFGMHVKQKMRFRFAEFVKRIPKLESALRKMRDPVWSIRKYKGDRQLAEWTTPVGSKDEGPVSRERVTLELLARMVMQHSDDRNAVEYALRAARRLRSPSFEGFAEVNQDGVPVKIIWRQTSGDVPHDNIASFHGAKI